MVVKVMLTMFVMSAVRGVDGGAAVDAGGGGGTVPRQELGGMPLSLSHCLCLSVRLSASMLTFFIVIYDSLLLYQPLNGKK